MGSNDQEVHLENPIDDTDFVAFNQKYQEYNLKEHELERYEDRKFETAFSLQTRKEIFKGKYTTMWRGINLMKDPCTIVILQHLLWDVKPQTIIEFGANTGGSAFYFADTMKTYGFKTHIYSMDIDLGLLSPIAKQKRDDITFLQGDTNKVEETFTPEFLKMLPHPWFVTDDAHVNTFGVLDYLDQFLMPGDYVLVEDIEPLTGCTAHYTSDNFANIKEQHLSAFIKKHPEKYRVDKRYCDFYGYNGSCNWNGFIKHI